MRQLKIVIITTLSFIIVAMFSAMVVNTANANEKHSQDSSLVRYCASKFDSHNLQDKCLKLTHKIRTICYTSDKSDFNECATNTKQLKQLTMLINKYSTDRVSTSY